jgi:hypothetical protein
VSTGEVSVASPAGGVGTGAGVSVGAGAGVVWVAGGGVDEEESHALKANKVNRPKAKTRKSVLQFFIVPPMWEIIYSLVETERIILQPKAAKTKLTKNQK